MSNPAPLSRTLLNALALLMRALIGATNWSHVREVVDRLMTDTTLSGAGKRAVAIAELRSLGLTLASALLNLAIEAAVVRLPGETQG
jgi:hypothetical protein